MRKIQTVLYTAFYTASMATIFVARVASASPSLPSLASGDVDNVIRELSANSSFHPVTPPSSLGSIFGFEVGLVGGETMTPDIDSLVQEQTSGSGAPSFPHANLLGALTVPLGLTVEGLFTPSLNLSGITYQNTGLGVKWTITDVFFSNWPLNIALRGFYSNTQISFSQTIQNPSTNGMALNSSVTVSDQVEGLQLLVSPRFIPIIEPYAGFGYLVANGSLSTSGSSTVTLFNYTTAQSASSSPTTTQLILGVDARLLFLGLGVEYTHEFQTSTYTGKLSFKF